MRAHLGGGHAPSSSRPLLICGATGTLGQAVARACQLRNIPFILTGRGELDLEDAATIDAAIDRLHPWAVVNAAGWVRVDDAEQDAAACLRANADGAIALADACSARAIPSLSFSSDLVFDGSRTTPYRETDPVNPRNIYGHSKARMEEGIGRLDGTHLIVRTAAFFSPHDAHNFAVAVVNSLSRDHAFQAADDLVVTPTYVPHLTATALDLLIDGERGIWHLANDEALSWADFARWIASALDLDAALVEPVPHRSFGLPAHRPAYTALATDRGAALPSLDQAIAHFAGHMRAQQQRQAA